MKKRSEDIDVFRRRWTLRKVSLFSRAFRAIPGDMTNQPNKAKGGRKAAVRTAAAAALKAEPEELEPISGSAWNLQSTNHRKEQ